MSRVYLSAAEHINNHPYLVLVSSSYAPNFPTAYLDGSLEPIYQNPTPDYPVRSMLAIKYLIDLFITNQRFIVVDEMDVIRIFHSLDAYLIEVADTAQIHAAVRRYAETVLKFRVEAYKNFVRTLNRHPDWKAAYSTGADALVAMFSLFAAPDFSKTQTWADPITRLAEPPIRLHDPTKPTPGTSTTSGMPVPYFYA